MPSVDADLLTFNAGQISPLGLARVDLGKLRAAAALQENFLPLVLGPAMLRPGTAKIAEVPGDAPGWLGEFYFDEDDVALLVVTEAGLQFLVADAYLTRAAVGSAITNGGFATDLSGWTQSDEAGAVSSWRAGGGLTLTGTGTNYAWRDQEVTVAAPDQGHEHALRLVVAHGNVRLMVGASQGDNSYWDETLLPGNYSLTLTPPGNFWIRLGGNDAFGDQVASIEIEGAGPVSLPVPWAQADFGLIRYDQSGDVVFAACASASGAVGYPQMRIERRSADSRSWGIASYLCDDGPFLLANSGPTTLAPSGVSGSVTLTASEPLFRAGHVGAIFSLTQSGQEATAALGGAGQATGAIQVSGLSNLNPGDPPTSERVFAIKITGTFVAKVTLQSSLGAVGDWTDVESWTGPVTTSYDDGLDNQIVFYQLIVETGNYTSGAAQCTLSYPSSVQTGIARVTAVGDTMHATADVLTEFGSSIATANWSEGEWSNYRGFPSAVVIHEDRMSWGTTISLDASVSDAYDSYDPQTLGDSGPIDRTVATGGLDGIRWLLSLQRLICGTAAQEISIRSDALDEPLTPTAFVARACSTRGCAKLRALKIDQQGIFVGRNGRRVYKLKWDATNAYVDYTASELTRLNQQICAAGAIDCAAQRQPDTYCWYVLADGTCAVLTYDEDDDVEAWIPVTTPNGLIERVASLPGPDEDAVYLLVNRSIGGVTRRFVEKLARRDESQGGNVSKAGMDCHLVYGGAPTATITGLDYLEGQQVVAWGDGAAVATATAPLTVAGGAVTLPKPCANVVVGLPVTAKFQSAKLAYGGGRGSALARQKRVDHVGLVMAYASWQGVKIGRNFTKMTGLPATYRGRPLGAGEVLASYDDVPGPFNGGWYSDARVCVEVTGPHPCTLMGLVVAMTTDDGSGDAGQGNQDANASGQR